VEPWIAGGRTDIENGCSLCKFHHARLHDGAFRLWRDASGELHFERPDGVEIRAPGRTPLDARTGGAAHLRRGHRERGLAIGPETPVSGWGGERGDLHYIADVFSEGALRARARAGSASGP
jgi:hypothetical protein